VPDWLPHPSWLTVPNWLPIPGWLDLVDITLVAIFGWLAIGYFRRTRARTALAGLAILAAVYFVARNLDLRLTAALFQAFFTVVVIVLIVVFQEDLRRVFERIGSWRRGSDHDPGETEVLDLLVRAVSRLAASRTGALIVLPGQEPLDRHVEGGVVLGGRLSEPLLLSIFDASSPGHDGAVVLRGPVLERFAVHLPLSSNHEALGVGGTRHAAALGLAERCDAICIAVSEERGTVSVARDGAIRTLARPEDLATEVRSTFDPQVDEHKWWQGRSGRDAVLAAIGALALWMVVVPGSDMAERSVQATVEVMNLPPGQVLEWVEPDSVTVTLRGLRRDLLLAERTEVSVRIDADLARFGRRTFTISAEDVRKSDLLSVVEVNPETVRISLQPASSAEAPRGS